jgi:hypothetical protein
MVEGYLYFSANFNGTLQIETVGDHELSCLVEYT